MATNLKVTFTTMIVTNNGDKSGKGSLYWLFLVDGAAVDSQSSTNPEKVADGAVIHLNQSKEVSKEVGQTLTIFGSVGEKDGGFSGKDEYDDFTDTYTSLTNWGSGTSKDQTLRNGALEVTVNYTIEPQ